MKIRTFAVLMTSLLLAAGAARLAAQATAPAAQASGQPKEEGQGIVARMAFEGSSSSDGQMMDLNMSAGYNFNKHFGVDLGFPVYFVHASTVSSTSGAGTRRSSSGDLGNVYADLRLTYGTPLFTYGTSLTGSLPTGDTSKGRSTGRVTFDWDNRLDHEFFDYLTPYVDAGVANSISDTRFFHRPFITLGKVAHFELGADMKIRKPLTLTLSAYDIAPWGQQRVFSRVVPRGSGGTATSSNRRVFEVRPETVTTADQVRDNGYSAGLSLDAVKFLSLWLGYTRSVPLHLDTVSFGVGVNLATLFRRSSRK